MQLTKPSNLRKENVIFREPKTDKHGNLIIKIQTKYANKTGPLVIETPFLFSFGVNERKSQESGELVGYTLPVCLWGMDEEPTSEQTEFEECLINVQEACHEYLEERYDSYFSERLSEILYYKQTTDEKGRKKRDDRFTVPPVLYTKLIWKDSVIFSRFRTKGDDNVDPMMFFEKYCTVKVALNIESIYISETSTSIQVKVSECYVKPQKLMMIEPILTIEESDED